LAISGGFILYAPRFLLYSSKYEKADSIILFLGPDFNARKKEAYRLMNEGMADYLIIPAYYKAYRIFGKGQLEGMPTNLFLDRSDKKDNNDQTRFYEDTHWEIIEAQKIMSNYKLTSAILVSSPYHMRRIKLIISRVFGRNKDNFYFVPTRYEKAPADYWDMSLADWKKVSMEYGKILWFILYSTCSK
jgi:hypothetical protein